MISFVDLERHTASIAVVGLGYVGLPLAVALGKHFSVIGFDISARRVQQLQAGKDLTDEVSHEALAASTVQFTHRAEDLAKASVIIVAVPTPITRHRQPDLAPLQAASHLVGSHMRKGTVLVYESTVYPGVTEDACAPIVEQASGFVCNRDFTLGYSPERINPGDKVHTVENIVKVVSGSTPATTELLASLYGKVIRAGVFRAASIKVAEAAKVIENTQRDLNIALMNELAIIFDKLGISTLDVLEAAGTKWNFLPFRPGLVGGHCIGVDPYYLTHKAESVGYHPQVILAGRRINDGMDKKVQHARVGIFGLTFKEDVPDLRNTRVIDIFHELEEYGITALVHDPLADPEEAQKSYGIELTSLEKMHDLDAAIIAVGHSAFVDMDLTTFSQRFRSADTAVVLDIKGIWSEQALGSVGTYWRL